jgi:hypothetical protein
MNAAPPFPVVPERIAEIIFALCQTVSTRLRKPTLSPAHVTYIVGRLLAIRKRFQRLVEGIRAGRMPREWTRTPREPEPAPEFPLGFRPPPPGWRRWAVRPEKPLPLWRSLRQHTFAWLLPLAPNVPDFSACAVAHRALLLDVLAAPETRALLLASRRVGDSLRPLCWMLGIESSVLYPAPLVSDVDAVSPAPAADARGATPVADEGALSAVATQGVAPAGPMMSCGIDPPEERPRAREGGDFFSDGLSGWAY